MSASNKQASAVQIADGELGDDQVREFLKANQDFLQRHPDMLDYLHIPHASGSAVSLVEKQVSVLRERNIDMRHRLSTLTGNARDNDKLYEQTRALVLKLIEACSPDELCRVFLHGMTNDFGVDHACMILYSDNDSNASYRTTSLEAAKAEVGALIKGDKAVCGTLRAEELRFLFPEGGDVGSAALMPLANAEPLGLIAVGSADANRYSSNVGTVFLTHIADVMVRLLPRMDTPE